MTHLSSIKDKLKLCNGTEFQELCDSFLKLRSSRYKAFVRSGAHDTKQKTTRGTPDSSFLLPNGLYIVVESTTTEHKSRRLINKLKDDIADCLNENKTGISSNKIQEIILCYNSNLTIAELEEVNKQAIEVIGIPPLHYGLDSLAYEIFFHHKNLAYDYLGLPLDTGQVVFLEKFIEEYDNGKQKLATPLGGKFLHRSKELEEIKHILNSGDIVIISGAAGVGKSKFALESINQFLELNLDYNAYAISPKGADLLGDLSTYFNGEESSILLVDDVNRVDKFEQIRGFYHSIKPGKLKLVLTVRDYALNIVTDWLSDYSSSIVELKGFSDEEINAIIEQEPFKILNGNFQNKINRIAKGNARLAVMMAMLARKTNSLESLNNVSDLFEKYFRTFVSDENTFKDLRILKSLGILSFFYIIPYTDGELLNSISESFGISGDDLREAFDRLHDLDLIELKYGHAKIGEQNFSTFYFYKVFIKDQLLSFESLFFDFFDKYEQRFKDTIYPIHKNFGVAHITNQIRPAFLSYFSNISTNEEKSIQFLNFAWKFLPNKTLSYLESKISDYEFVETSELKTEYQSNRFENPSNQEKHLKLLSNFFGKQATIGDALDLSFDFVLRLPEHLPQLIYHLDRAVNFTTEDYKNHFVRHRILVDFLVEEVEKGKLQAHTFFAVSRKLINFLLWKYKDQDDAKNDDANITSVKSTRGKILEILCEQYEVYPKEVFDVILGFSTGYIKDSKYTRAFDFEYLKPWIDENLDPSNFQHCYYVQEMIRSAKRKSFDHQDFDQLKSTFSHRTYSDYIVLDWSRRRAMDDFDFADRTEFEKLKDADIAKNFTFKSITAVKSFFTRYIEILSWDKIKLHSQHSAIHSIIKANLAADKNIGFIAFLEFVKLQDSGIYGSQVAISYYSFDRIAEYSDLVERFLGAVESENLDKIRQYEILTSIPDHTINQNHLKRLYSTVIELNRDFYLQFQRLRKYEKIDPEVLEKILQLVVRKIEEENLSIRIQDDFFEQEGVKIKDAELLKKAYIQQDRLDHHFDYSGKELLVILKRAPEFLLEYIKMIFESNELDRIQDHRELAIVWELPNIVELLDEVMEYIVNAVAPLYLFEDFATVFFQQNTSNVEKADNYLLHLIEKYSDQPKMINTVFVVINHSKNALFSQAFDAYIKKNQDLECFKQINWTEQMRVFSGDVIVGEVKASEWEWMLSMVENTQLGRKTRAIRNYIKNQRDHNLRYAEDDRQRKFFSRY